MRALIVYESMFGDSQAVARAIAEGLATDRVPADALEVGLAPVVVPEEVGLLVVGSPNHGWSMPRPETRRDAAAKRRKALVSQGIGVREWLARAVLPAGIRVAAYDTRVSHPKVVVVFDHASHQIEQGLVRLGGVPLVPAEHFRVVGMTGPLESGERDRALAWGRALAHALAG